MSRNAVYLPPRKRLASLSPPHHGHPKARLEYVPVVPPPLEPKPEEVDLILYHGYCSDGFAAVVASYILWEGTQATPGKPKRPLPIAIGMQHDKYERDMPDVKGKNVAIFDFSLPLYMMHNLKRDARSYVLWDHHDTARQLLETFPNCHFDMKHSGAVLAWKFFLPHLDYIPWLFQYVEDRDLWAWKLPQSRAVSKYVWHHLGMDVQAWVDVIHDEHRLSDLGQIQFLDKALPIGKPIMAAEETLQHQIMNYSFEMQLDGVRCALVNANVLISELGEALLEKYPLSRFAVVYTDDGSMENRHFRLRSRDPEKDPQAVHVGELAARYGGGGHPGAAAFHVKPPPGHVTAGRNALLFRPVGWPYPEPPVK